MTPTNFLSLQVKVNNQVFQIIAVFRTHGHGSKTQQFIQNLKNVMNNSKCQNTILTGDFTLNICQNSNSMMAEMNFISYINDWTRLVPRQKPS